MGPGRGKGDFVPRVIVNGPGRGKGDFAHLWYFSVLFMRSCEVAMMSSGPNVIR